MVPLTEGPLGGNIFLCARNDEWWSGELIVRWVLATEESAVRLMIDMTL
jgi:hypothetical protein